MTAQDAPAEPRVDSATSAPLEPAQASVERVSIDSLHIDPANVRVHDERNKSTIRASLARFGAGRSIVLDRNNVVRAGNGTLEQARQAGFDEVLVIEPRPNQLVAVKRPDWSDTEATAYSVQDNRSTDLSRNDDAALAATLEAVRNEDASLLEATGYTGGEVDELLKSLADVMLGNGEASEDPGPQIDRADELQKKWSVKLGDLFIIPSKTTPGGEHRLLCGDCRKIEDVERACGGKIQGAFTSPPYAEQRKEQYGGTPADQYVAWWEAVQANVRKVLWQDGSFFVNIKAHCEDGERSLYVLDLVSMMKRGWAWRYVEEFCWKNSGVPKVPARRFKNQFEPIHQFAAIEAYKFNPTFVMHESDRAFSKAGKGRASSMQGQEDWSKDIEVHEGLAYPGNVIAANYDNHDGNGAGHAAAFPVALPEFFLKAFSDPGDSWLDPFVGSGTTIVAAEQTGRLARGIELAPRYVAVALERLEGLGLRPALSVDASS